MNNLNNCKSYCGPTVSVQRPLVDTGPLVENHCLKKKNTELLA